MVYKEIQKI